MGSENIIIILPLKKEETLAYTDYPKRLHSAYHTYYLSIRLRARVSAFASIAAVLPIFSFAFSALVGIYVIDIVFSASCTVLSCYKQGGWSFTGPLFLTPEWHLITPTHHS